MGSVRLSCWGFDRVGVLGLINNKSRANLPTAAATPPAIKATTDVAISEAINTPPPIAEVNKKRLKLALRC